MEGWKQLKNLNTVPNEMNTLPPEFNNNVEEMNKHFLSVTVSLNEDCTEITSHYENTKYNFEGYFEFRLPSSQDITEIIYKLISNVVGGDEISGNMTRLCMPQIMYTSLILV